MDRNTIPMVCDAGAADGGQARAKKPRKPRAKKAAAASHIEPSLNFESGLVETNVEAAIDASANSNSEHEAAADSEPRTSGVHNRLGGLARTLHDALRELGHDKGIADARATLPDARERLSYIARLTGDAADKVLNAVDSARGVQDEMSAAAAALSKRWEAVESFAAKGGRATPAGRQLIDETTRFLNEMQGSTERTNAILTDIMLAQDFHDLTGQVIRRIVDLAQTVEEQLVALLVETSPVEPVRKVDTSELAGPVVNGEGRPDVVTDQGQVDDLLASLGF